LVILERKDMKKVLFLIDTLDGGGAEKVFYDIVRNLNRTKYEIDILLIENRGLYKDKLEKLGFNIEYLLKKRGNRIVDKIKKSIYIFFPQLIKKIYEKNYDVQIGFLEGNTTVITANTKGNRKKIGWVHIDLEKTRNQKGIEQRINSFIERRAYRKLDKIVCVADDTKKAFLRLYPELKDKVEVIYNLIDVEEIQEKACEKERKFNNQKINIISVGRLVKQKGYDILLEAHYELLKEGLDYNIYILGEGVERKELEKYIKEKQIEKNTFLLGFKENPYPYIKEANIFVSSSRNEGFSLVVAEALCLGKPIIATKCAGPIELLENGKYGVLVENENKEELKNEIRELVLNKDKREKYSRLSFKRAMIFNKKIIIKKIEKILRG
jgi:glycosyltransferase involved in cell wall biosynthesis